MMGPDVLIFTQNHQTADTEIPMREQGMAPLKPVVIGDYVTIGHNAVVHGCQIHDRVLIGMGATLLNGAVIEEGAIVAAGAVVKENMIVPANTLVAGVPAKIVKTLDISAQSERQSHAQAYENLWRQHYRGNL